VCRGWRVLPAFSVDAQGLCACERGPDCVRPGKHPRTPNGHLDATNDPKVLSRWFEPGDANLGVVFEENICVVDLDGFEAVRWAKAHEIEPAMTASFCSSPGHFQLLFLVPSGVEIKRSIKEIFSHKTEDGRHEGVDILPGGEGYSVMPPSRHASGCQYAWETDPDALVEMPEHLLRLILDAQNQRQAPKAPSRPSRIAEYPLLAGVEEGKRNSTLYRLACGWRSRSLPIVEAAVLADFFSRRSRPPLSQDEIWRILVAAYQHPAGPSSGRSDVPSDFDPDLVPLPPTVAELLATPYPQADPLVEKLINERSYGMMVGKPGRDGLGSLGQAI
jgi:hypothetical protein